MITIPEEWRQRMIDVSLGEAPDGMPWQLGIDRGPSAASLLQPISSWFDSDFSAGDRSDSCSAVLAALEHMIEDRDYREISMGSRTATCFVSAQPLHCIFPPTILQSVLGGTPTVRPSGRRPDTRPAAQVQQSGASGAKRHSAGFAHLAVPLDGQLPLVARKTRTDNRVEVHSAREWRPESLCAFPGARYELRSPNDFERRPCGLLNDRSGYLAACTQRARTAHAELGYELPIEEIVGAIAGIALRIVALHEAGEVHGDVKPANVLVTARGIEVIDSLGLAPGQPSTAMTPGWAAPEQILGRPVLPATDQFPLGIMLVSALGGVHYGEEVTCVVPTGGAGAERFRLFRDPGVYIDPETNRVDAEGAVAWQRLVGRLLRFDPADRFPTMDAAAAAIRETLLTNPARGYLRTIADFGAPSWLGGFAWRLEDLRRA